MTTPTPPQPLLLAGCGYVARRLCAALPPGTPVRAHARRARHEHGVPAGVQAWDLDADTVPPGIDLTGATVLYSIPPGGSGEHDARIARWLQGVGGQPARIVYLSTSGVYGDRGGAAVDEHSAPAPTQPRSVRRLDAELKLGGWCATHGVALVILRLPAIYGPHRLPLQRLQRGEPVLLEAHASPGYRVHVDDVVGAILRACRPGVPAGTYLLRDDSSLSIGAYLALVAELAGLPPPEAIDAASARQRLSPAMLAHLDERRRLDDSASRRVLGHRLRYPQPAGGVRASLAEMGLTPVSRRGGDG